MNVNLKAIATATKNGAITAANKTLDATPRGMAKGVVQGSKAVVNGSVKVAKTAPKIRFTIQRDEVVETESE